MSRSTAMDNAQMHNNCSNKCSMSILLGVLYSNDLYLDFEFFECD
jgi:hypothetical protein